MSWMDAILTGFAIGIVMGFMSISTREDDMKVCQLSHSFDTCHNALNR